MLNPMNFLGGVRNHTSTFGSGGRDITLERSLPAPRGTHPAVILLHGSDGLDAAGPRFRLMMQALAGLGYAALLPHYFARTGDADLGSGSRRSEAIARSFPLWQEAIVEAVAEAARLPGIDPQRIGLCGFSLGAFLALGVAARAPQVRCVIEFCGGLPEDLVGRPFTMPSVLILHGEADATVPVAHARTLEEALRTNHVPHEAHIYPGQGHVLQGQAERDALQHCLAFLETHLAVRQ
ncbi:MAG: dienelactone hydrolase family protein [Armatimonadetes bacterium]|nr:dienelactone hydrolase family protein [Armatimonadota bacterium]